ncbi:MAG: hydrolase [Flavobacteriaceae bacterium]|nr:MAG: hydrolase [Flavobacteriaceae bacterium]
MKFQMLCSDLDGTLLSTKDDVSDFTISEVSRIKEAMQIVLVSARMPKSMTYLQERLGIAHEPIICYNGALVLDGKKELSSTFMDIEYVEKVYQLAEKHNIKLGLYYNDEWYVEIDSERVQKEINYTHATPVFRNTKDTIKDWKQREIGAHKIMLMGTKEDADDIFPLLQKSLGLYLHLYRSNDTLIEVAPISVSKLSAIKSLLPNKEALQKVIAFGDNYNDMEMLKFAGSGVAVANGRKELKAIANHVTLKNTEHGVAHFIKEHLVI